MINVCLGLILELKYGKFPSLGFFCFEYVSITYLVALKANVSYLLGN